jgi:hypothetical protein
MPETKKINPWLKLALELGPIAVFFIGFSRLKDATEVLEGQVRLRLDAVGQLAGVGHADLARRPHERADPHRGCVVIHCAQRFHSGWNEGLLGGTFGSSR